MLRTLFFGFFLTASLINSAYSDEISPAAAEIIFEVIENSNIEEFSSEEEYLDFIEQNALILAEENGIILDENKNLAAVRTAIRVAWNAVKSGAAHAATHDGRGRCNSGCGRRGGRSSP
jgi:hypothetical protein